MLHQIPSNAIELYDAKTNELITLRLFRVMSIGHLEEPNEDAQYKAVLRVVAHSSQLLNPTKKRRPEDVGAVIPKVFEPVIHEAFTRDCFVLAKVNTGCLESVIMLEMPEVFNAEAYLKRHGSEKYMREIA